MACQSKRSALDPLDKKEIDAILNTARRTNEESFPICFFLIALEWGDIDWINGHVHVSRAKRVKIFKKSNLFFGDNDICPVRLQQK